MHNDFTIRMLAGKGFLLGILFFLFSCQADEKEANPLPEEASLLPMAPSHFPPLPPEPNHNPTTVAGIKLGERLFFDPRLSANGRLSCASCHLPNLAFTDGVSLTTIGVSGKALHRHAPTLVNIAYADKGLFWDGGSNNLESLSFGPLQHPDEMGLDNLDKIMAMVSSLEKDTSYPLLFESAFGKDTITTVRISQALAQYQRTLIYANSTYDRYVLSGNESIFTEKEAKGFQLFQENCAMCHVPPLFTDHLYHNNGLDSSFSDDSHEGVYQGRYRITLKEEDLGKFKTPTLRNIQITAPYMHDGRFQRLEEVLNHYAEGIRYSKTLDSALTKEGYLGLSFTPEEKQHLVAFLNTLTDSTFMEN